MTPNNILLNPGQVGIFIAGGTHNAIVDNVVYGEQRPLSNVGIYVWNQTDEPCSDHGVAEVIFTVGQTFQRRRRGQ